MPELTDQQRAAMVKEYCERQPMDEFLYARTSAYNDGLTDGYTAAKAEPCVWTQDDDIADMPG